MRRHLMLILAASIMAGGWLNVASAQTYPPSPHPPLPGQQSIEEQNEIFRMIYMTDEDRHEYSKRKLEATSPGERRMLNAELNRRMRQRAAEQGVIEHKESVPGWPGTGPDTVWWCLRYDCYKKEPLFPLIYP